MNNSFRQIVYSSALLCSSSSLKLGKRSPTLLHQITISTLSSKMSSTATANFPTPNPESRKILLSLLDKCHTEFDINYQDYLASHVPHALGSLYTLGATPQRLESYYNWYVKRLEPLRQPNFIVDETNWKSYIGNIKAYAELLEFFDQQVTTLGIQKSLHKFLPTLIPGLIGAALHPLIHVSYAIEYELPKVLAEGLAYACTYYHKNGEIIINKVQDLEKSSSSPPSSVLEIIQELKLLGINEKLRQQHFDRDVDYVLTKYESNILELVKKWNCTTASSTSSSLEAKLNELTLASILTFFGSYRKNSLDFFLCHGLTGNHAVRILLPHLTEEKDKIKLLNLNFIALLGIYIIEGIPEFSEDVINNFKPKGEEDKDKEDINWNDVIDKAVNGGGNDEHMVKVVKSLIYIHENVMDSVISHKLLLNCAFLVVHTIRNENEWNFDGIGYL